MLRGHLSFLQDRLGFLDRPAVAGGNLVHLGAAVHEHVGADLILGRYDGQISLGFQLSKVEIAREDLPARAVVEIEDVTLGNGV